MLVEAVTPESATINAAIVKSMDALSAEDGAAWPVLVYDSGDGWDSDKLGLLNYAGGSVMSFDHIGQGNLLEAA